MNWNVIDKYAKSLIEEAGHRIRISFDQPLHVDSKAHANDLVTNVDRETEQFFIENIKKDFPEHRILGEEGFGDDVKALEGITWILDPIDGTMNFVHQKRNFAISLGIFKDGVGVLGYIYDVIHDELYRAKKGEGAYLNGVRLPKIENDSLENSLIGISANWVVPNRRLNHEKVVRLLRKCSGTRSYGSAAMEIAYVASGRLGAYISTRLSPWDIAGGVIIAEEVGAVATNLKGDALCFLKQDTFIVTNPSLHEDILNNYIELKEA